MFGRKGRRLIIMEEAGTEERNGDGGVEEIKEEVIVDEIFAKIAADDVPAVSSILGEDKTKVEILDEHGMTPFQHAAYKGNKQMCQVLIDYVSYFICSLLICSIQKTVLKRMPFVLQGADVNGGKHNNGYTALHFAALSGNASLCQLLLQKGARPTAQNSVNRTAAQMAAFVGISSKSLFQDLSSSHYDVLVFNVIYTFLY